MFKNKKGDMTLNIIIAAAIAMVVLVVMLLIFTGKIQVFNQDCPGDWKYPQECGKDGNFDPTCQVIGTFKNPEPGKICCTTENKENCG